MLEEKKEFDGNTPITEENLKEALECPVVEGEVPPKCAEDEEVLDTPIELSEETIDQVKDAIADEVRQEAGISAEQSELFKQMCKEASMPVEYLDSDFTLGPNELDIRKLSKRNFNQMIFRTLVLQNVYLKNIVTSLVDITRLIMIGLDKMGVENIVQATDDIITKITEQNEELQRIIKNKKKD